MIEQSICIRPQWVGAIISAVVAIGSTITSAAMQSSARKKASEQGLKLAQITREDTLRREKEQEKQTRKSLALQEKQLGIQQTESILNRKTQDKLIREGQLQNLAQMLTNVSSSNIGFRNDVRRMFGGR